MQTVCQPISSPRGFTHHYTDFPNLLLNRSNLAPEEMQVNIASSTVSSLSVGYL